MRIVMGLFTRKAAARAAARPALARGWGGRFGEVGQPLGQWPQTYESQLRDAIGRNAIGQRALRLVAEGAAAVPIYANRDDHPALALIRRTSAGQALIETAAAHLALHGNAYVQIVAGADGLPAALYPLRPERVTIEPDASG
ncbi:MAG: phage portal protein, partial [Sphingomonadaceae bacterium]|nr:phage portal protein [Sphingomonadaceae bacterium]